MITKALLYSLGCLLLLGSCASPKYMPSYDKIDVSEYGSYIKIRGNNIEMTAGELIAIDKGNFIILSEKERKCVSIPLREVNNYTLKYAQPKHYGWTIPVFSVVSLGHGLLALISLPVSLSTTSAVTASGETAFTYNKKSIPIKKLNQFARFPQGIPPNISLEMIK
ncbi:MAG: hypothetical protein OEY34_07810 [Cyclobacteriaceae bacterium]|nr:hypothetical protein [Cyclobacteriaceae bacterium]